MATLKIEDLSIVSAGAKCISLLSVIYIIVKILLTDLDQNACILFTRISKRKWLIKKIIGLIGLIIILRLPLYIYVNFSKIFVPDLILYILIIFYAVNYLLNQNKINLAILLLSLFLIFISVINYKLCLIIFAGIVLLLIKRVIFKEKI
jgi:hypothetical protein